MTRKKNNRFAAAVKNEPIVEPHTVIFVCNMATILHGRLYYRLILYRSFPTAMTDNIQYLIIRSDISC